MPENQPQLPSQTVQMLASQESRAFSGILRQLQNISCSNREAISDYERQTYNLLRSYPQNLDGLVTFLQIQLMLGNHQKAHAIANRIWEIGGTLEPAIEKKYINCLLNLGQVEMAALLLRPYFEKMREYIGEYGRLFLKYAILTGQLNAIDKIAAQLPSGGLRKPLVDFAAVYRYLNYVDAFKAIQRSVLDNVKDTICAYEFNLYTDRGFTDLEILLYVGSETSDCKSLRNQINLQASAVCAAKGVKRLHNLGFVVRPISSCAKPMLD